MNIKKQISRFALLFTIAAVLFSCSEDDKKEVTRLDAISVMVANDANFSILNAALKKTGLDVTLTNAGSFTVFAPTNAAFTASASTLSVDFQTVASINALTMPADAIKIANLRVILLNHVLGVGTRADDLLAAKYVKTFAFFRTNAPVPANPVTSIITSNASGLLSMYVNQVGTDVLINGGAANNGAKVTQSNIQLSNGIVHVIDRVLTLPTVADHINANPDFATLATIINSPDQAATKTIITGATNLTPRTIIVPNAAAFTTALAAAAGTTPAGFLVGMTPANVTKVLQYHQLAGNRARTFFLDNFTVNTQLTVPVLQTYKTFTSGALGFRIEDNAIAPRNKVSKFVLNDIQAVNGALHVVDKVLEPTL